MRLDRQKPDQDPGEDRLARCEGQPADHQRRRQRSVLSEDLVRPYGRAEQHEEMCQDRQPERSQREMEQEQRSGRPHDVGKPDRHQGERDAYEQYMRRIAPFLRMRQRNTQDTVERLAIGGRIE